MSYILIIFILLSSDKGICHFQFTNGNSRKNKNIKIYYAPKGLYKKNRRRSNCVLLIFYMGLGNVYLTYNIIAVFLRFWELENVLSHEGTLQRETNEVKLFSIYVLFGVGKRILDFQFTHGFLPFRELENVHPLKGLCKSNTKGGIIE